VTASGEKAVPSWTSWIFGCTTVAGGEAADVGEVAAVVRTPVPAVAGLASAAMTSSMLTAQLPATPSIGTANLPAREITSGVFILAMTRNPRAWLLQWRRRCATPSCHRHGGFLLSGLFSLPDDPGRTYAMSAPQYLASPPRRPGQRLICLDAILTSDQALFRLVALLHRKHLPVLALTFQPSRHPGQGHELRLPVLPGNAPGCHVTELIRGIIGITSVQACDSGG
jgi:hypothetical protein